MTGSLTRPLEWAPPKQAISRVPYLPGLDGMRALAVVAVMVYHANSDWLPGGFLGVEVFFVISGYLITLLLIGEHERTGRVDLKQFWLRRARRLLPALFVLLIGITIYTALFRRDALGQLRGDVVAGLTYVSNWYQIWVGQGYTASGDFAPLRHLWSLAVEEQFYLLWPLAMVGLMRLGRRRLPELSRWLFVASVAVTVVLAVLYHPGEVGSCTATPDAYWTVGERCLNKTDALYLNSITRSGGLLIGAAFAMIWRPVAIMRGPMRNKGNLVDLVGLIGLVGLAALNWYLHLVTPAGADPWLFRGGFLLTGIATVAVMAAVTHRGGHAGAILGNPVLLWIGTRSYGLYLYHWPIYQIIREVAGNPLTLAEFVLAIAITLPITEISYRFVETPIRKGHVGRWWRRLQAKRDPTPRRMIGAVGAGLVAMSVFAAANLATAELRPNEIQQSLEQGSESVTDIGALLPATTTTTEPTVATTTPATTTPTTVANDAGSTPAAPVPVPPTVAPTTVAPPTTTGPTTTTTTTAPGPKPTLAIGDSVMLGAAGPLADGGIVVNAEESRQMNTMVPVMAQLSDGGAFGDVVVVQLGTNGPIGSDTVTDFFTAVADVPRVIVLTVRAPRNYTAGNNAKLFDAASQFPNVEILDWGGLSNSCPGDCFANDDIHLNAAGADYYARLIFDTIDA